MEDQERREQKKHDSQNTQPIPRRSGTADAAAMARCTKVSKFSTWKIIQINVGKKLKHTEVKEQNKFR